MLLGIWLIYSTFEVWVQSIFFVSDFEDDVVMCKWRRTAMSDMFVLFHPWGHYNFQHFKEEKKDSNNCFHSIWWKLKHKTISWVILSDSKCLERRQKKEWVMHTHWLHHPAVYMYMRHRPWPSFPSKGSRPLKAGRHFCIKEDVPHFCSSCWALAQ